MANRQDKGVVSFMAPLVIGNMLNPLNSTMLATALVAICSAFKQDQGSGALLIVPLYLTSAIGQPLMGRLADLFSAQKVNIAGFVFIFISALIGISAHNFSTLIVSRILLGLGSSAAYPSSMALIRQRYAVQQREVPGIMLSIVAIASQVSIAFGPFLGGMLTEHFGWKSIFFVNIPLVALAMLLTFISKQAFAAQKEKTVLSLSAKLHSLDLPGAGLFCIFLVLFLHTLLYTTLLWVKVPLVVLFLVLFIRRELRQEQPFINVKLLALNLSLNTTFLRQIAINFVIYLILYGLPQWLEQSKNISPSRVGLMMLPLSLAAMAISLLIARYKKYLRLLSWGTACIIGASAGLFFLNTGAAPAAVIAISILVGIATGIMTIANQGTLFAEAPKDQTGISFGLYRTVGYIGAIVAGSRLKHEFQGGATDAGLHRLAVYTLAACVLILLFLVPVFFKRTTQLHTVKQ